MASLCVDASGHELGGRGDNRKRRFRVDEVVKLSLSIGLITRDAHDVSLIRCGEVGIGVHHRLPHPLSMILVFTEDDSLGEPIGRFQKLGHFLGDDFGALLKDESSVVVEYIVLAILYELAVPIGLALL